jgi:hypothetical protein
MHYELHGNIIFLASSYFHIGVNIPLNTLFSVIILSLCLFHNTRDLAFAAIQKYRGTYSFVCVYIFK